MQNSKPWWQSKAVWGGLIALLAGIAGAFGYAVSPDEQAKIAEAVVAVAGGVGGLVAVYGRVKARSQIE